MEINRKTIIVPNENKIKDNIFYRNLTIDEAHGLGVKEFSDKHNLGLTCEKLGIEENDYHDFRWFTESCKLGNLIIQQDENVIIYLPPVITSDQYRYLLENKENFKKYGHSLHAYSIFYENGKFYHDDLDELIHQYENELVDVLYEQIKKKYIPNKDSFILVIPNEEEFKIEKGYYFEEFDSNIGHAEMFKIFCMRHMIPIKVPEITGNPWGKELANKGFFVAKREKDEIYLFIPRNLSNNQNNWLDNNKDYLNNFNQLEAGVYFETGEYKEIFESNEYPKHKTVKELIEEIYEEVKNKNSKRR